MSGRWTVGLFSSSFDDEPGDEFKVGGFAGLFLLVGDHEVATGLQASGDALLEGPGDGVHGGFQQLVVRAHVGAVVGLGVEQLASCSWAAVLPAQSRR